MMKKRTTPSPVVLVVGDFLEDRYWVGEASRLSPEGPFPVVNISRVFNLPGGAGNVAANLRTMGITTIPLGDHPRKPIKHRLMVGDHQIVRWDEVDVCNPLKQIDVEKVDLSGVVGVVVADYLKGTLSPWVVEWLADLNLPTFVDTKGDPSPYLSLFRDVVMFPNLKEYSQYQDTYNSFREVVLKKGPDGLDLLKYGGVVRSVPSRARFVRSVNGAGDTVVAGFVAAKIKNLFDPLDYAAWAAGRVVELPYTAVPTIRVEEDFLFAA